ncbi:hypothetical protein ACIRRA_22235 [Nocardia sp. NPDC101769]|uniref:hypothetical protein n=1 Tax=Nocardia sp. NPDC101769 TaxID=3364333 RepID=UPI003807916E
MAQWGRWLMRLLPPQRREFADALLAEAEYLPDTERARWRAGVVWFVLREVIMHRMLYPFGLAAAAAIVIATNYFATSDDSSQVVVLVLMIAAFVLGLAVPRRAWLSGAVLGSALAVASASTLIMNPRATVPQPGGFAGAATLLVLIIPALAVAGLGALIGRRRPAHA